MTRLIVRAGDDGAEGSPGGNLSAPHIHIFCEVLGSASLAGAAPSWQHQMRSCRVQSAPRGTGQGVTGPDLVICDTMATRRNAKKTLRVTYSKIELYY